MKKKYFVVSYSINYDKFRNIDPRETAKFGPFKTVDDAAMCAQALNATNHDHHFSVSIEDDEPPKVYYYLKEYYLLSGERCKRSSNAYGCFSTFDEAMERLTTLMKDREQSHSREEFVYTIVRKKEEAWGEVEE